MTYFRSDKCDNSLDLMREVILTAEALGESKTKEILERERKLDDGREKSFRKIVLRACAKAFGIPQKNICSGRQLGDRTDALKSCFIITRIVLSYNSEQIGDMFGGKDKSLPKKYIREFKQMKRDGKIKAHANFFIRFDQAFKEVKEEFKIQTI